jgi:hypothetical protein
MNREEVEITWLENLGGEENTESGWYLCSQHEHYEGRFKTEQEAIERLKYLKESLSW